MHPAASRRTVHAGASRSEENRLGDTTTRGETRADTAHTQPMRKATLHCGGTEPMRESTLHCEGVNGDEEIDQEMDACPSSPSEQIGTREGESVEGHADEHSTWREQPGAFEPKDSASPSGNKLSSMALDRPKCEDGDSASVVCDGGRDAHGHEGSFENKGMWWRLGCGCASGRWEWNFIDGIFVINLQERPDRLAELHGELHLVGLCRRVIIYRPTKPTEAEWAAFQRLHPNTAAAAAATGGASTTQKTYASLTRGSWGCRRSHRAIMAYALARGYQRILIIEDDAKFLPALTQHVVNTELPRALADLPLSADFFYLGFVPRSAGIPIWPGESRFGQVLSLEALTTVCYVATAKGMKAELEAPMEMPIDVWMSRNARQYGLYPKVVWQRPSTTDIEEVWYGCDTTPIKVFGMRFYTNHMRALDAAILFVIPVILALLAMLVLFFLARATIRFVRRAYISTNNIQAPLSDALGTATPPVGPLTAIHAAPNSFPSPTPTPGRYAATSLHIDPRIAAFGHSVVHPLAA